MCSYFESYQPISMSRNPPYGQVLMLGVHSLDACKKNAVSFLRCPNRQLTGNIQQFGGRHFGGPCSITGSSATVRIVWTHHGISHLEIKVYFMRIEG